MTQEVKHLTPEQISQCCDPAECGEASTEVREHAATCETCRGEVALQREVDCCVREIHSEPSFDFTDAVMASVAPEPRDSFFTAFFHNVPAVMTLAAAALAIVLVPMLPRTGGHSVDMGVPGQVMGYLSTAFEFLTTTIDGFMRNPVGPAVIFAAFTILLFAGVDRAIAHRRAR